MLRLKVLPALVTGALLWGTPSVRAQNAQPAPPKPNAAAPAPPTPNAAAPATPAKPSAPAATPRDASAAATASERTGVVLVEQAGRVVSLGLLLHDDGRVLTAQSALKPANAGQILVRYPDGATMVTRVGHSDRERDLALLVPKALRSHTGVQASRSVLPAPGAALSSFSIGANRSVTRAQVSVKGISRAGSRAVIELTPALKPSDVGAPLLDVHGQAVGIVINGCVTSAAVPAPPSNVASAAPAPGAPSAAPSKAAATPSGPTTNAPCAAEPVGMPVAEIRAFLRTLPPEAEPAVPWLGIDGVSADNGVVRGLRVGYVEPKSPAAALGLAANTESAPGDLLVAVNGKPVPNPEALRRTLTSHLPGERVELLVYGKGAFRAVSARLAERPTSPP